MPFARLSVALLAAVATLAPAARGLGQDAGSLPGTAPLELEGDIASLLIDACDRFLLGEIESAADPERRRARAAAAGAADSVGGAAERRLRLAHILGVRDVRPVPVEIVLDGALTRPARVAASALFTADVIRWPALGSLHGEGLLLAPVGRAPIADVVALPDADVTPEMLAGLAPGVAPESQFARHLAERGCRVVVPVLVHRGITHRKIVDREFLYRSAFELGRHIIGYEVQKALAAIDAVAAETGGARPIGVFGHGEGGLIALHAAALDTRIAAACVSGHFDARHEVWNEPVYRNVFGLLDGFGDAEVAALVAPRALVVEAARGPEVEVPAGTGGAPGRIATPPLERARQELRLARGLSAGRDPRPVAELVVSGDDGRGPPGSEAALRAFLDALIGDGAPPAPAAAGDPPRILAPLPDAAARQRRQFVELDRHNQELLHASAATRREFFSKLDTSSLERYAETIEPYRAFFRDAVIGSFARELAPPSPRTRRAFEDPAFVGHEVVLDVFGGVFAYGLLLVPRDIAPGDRRPVVVCQHGLEGRPRDVADPSVSHPAYGQYAAVLARKGFVTFAPQNIYIFGDRFRALQRKANPLGKTLFSIMVPQHRQIADWLASLPFVDPERIAFYGLSYGGKSAMRIPPLVERYCLSICSADFNEWVDKNASSTNPRSYVWTGEYEIFEFDLGSTFNYAEMAALIAPRPFMVERGHFDGVADDETVAYEFAKVRNLYAARLKIPDRCAIEWFDGPHAIHGKGTFEFLERHLRGK